MQNVNMTKKKAEHCKTKHLSYIKMGKEFLTFGNAVSEK